MNFSLRYKGLTIVNIPERAKPDVIVPTSTESKRSTLDENCNTVNGVPASSPTSAQSILSEMFSCLTPQRRNLRNSLDANSLSVKARSISPEPRRPQVPPAVKSETRDLRVGPSPTPAHSRPTSARRSNKENVSPANFSVKNFSHFCFDDDVRTDNPSLYHKTKRPCCCVQFKSSSQVLDKMIETPKSVHKFAVMTSTVLFF